MQKLTRIFVLLLSALVMLSCSTITSFFEPAPTETPVPLPTATTAPTSTLAPTTTKAATASKTPTKAASPTLTKAAARTNTPAPTAGGGMYGLKPGEYMLNWDAGQKIGSTASLTCVTNSCMLLMNTPEISVMLYFPKTNGSLSFSSFNNTQPPEGEIGGSFTVGKKSSIGIEGNIQLTWQNNKLTGSFAILGQEVLCNSCRSGFDGFFEQISINSTDTTPSTSKATATATRKPGTAPTATQTGFKDYVGFYWEGDTTDMVYSDKPYIDCQPDVCELIVDGPSGLLSLTFPNRPGEYMTFSPNNDRYDGALSGSLFVDDKYYMFTDGEFYFEVVNSQIEGVFIFEGTDAMCDDCSIYMEGDFLLTPGVG